MPSKGGAGPHNPIVLDDSETEDEDAELDRVAVKGKPNATSNSSDDQAKDGHALFPSVGGMTQSERAQLELERRKRAAKRAAEETSSPQRPSQRPRLEGPSASGAPIHTLTTSAAYTPPGRVHATSDSPQKAHVHTVNTCYERIQPGDRFWDGTVRVRSSTYLQCVSLPLTHQSTNIPQRSFNHFAIPAPSGMRFEDMLLPTTAHDPAGCTHVLFSSFCADPTWLPGLLPSGSGAPHVTLVDDMQKPVSRWCAKCASAF